MKNIVSCSVLIIISMLSLRSQSPPLWAIDNFDTDSLVAFGTFDYTSWDTSSYYYRPDTNILGYPQPIKDESWIFIPRFYSPSSDTVIVIFHGGGFRAGDVDFSKDEAGQITKETGYITVLVEYPRGLSSTDPQYTGGTPTINWFCSLSTDSINMAIDLAIDYTALSLDAISTMEVRYKDSLGVCMVLDPYGIVIDDSDPPATESSTCEIVNPSALILMGNSAGGAIVYENVLFNDAAAKWKVIGAISLWGAYGYQRFFDAGFSIPYTDVPILAVHNPCDQKSPYIMGRPFGVVPQPNDPPSDPTLVCCPTAFPLSIGSKWLVDLYRANYAASIGNGRMLLISSCDTPPSGGHGAGFFADDDLDPEESTFKGLKTFLWWLPNKELFAAQNAWHLMLYSMTPTADVEWDGNCDVCPDCP